MPIPRITPLSSVEILDGAANVLDAWIDWFGLRYLSACQRAVSLPVLGVLRDAAPLVSGREDNGELRGAPLGNHAPTDLAHVNPTAHVLTLAVLLPADRAERLGVGVGAAEEGLGRKDGFL